MISHHTSRARHGAFTIVELMVVLAIGTIVAAITVGGFKSVSENNRKTTCQANLAQIYLASRQYAQDSDGHFPYLNPDNGVAPNRINTPVGGFGLWSLYAFPVSNGTVQNCPVDNDNTNDAFAEPEQNSGKLAGYARALKIFHCPSDKYPVTVSYSTNNCAASSTKELTSGEPIFTADGGTQKLINPFFMSYQGLDSLSNDHIYSVFRKSYVANDPDPARASLRQLQPFRDNGTTTQIIQRAPDATTVITWCRFHRSLKDRNTTNDGKRNYDNVLFYDGSIQFLPTRMRADGKPTSAADTSGKTGWNRLPRGVAG